MSESMSGAKWLFVTIGYGWFACNACISVIHFSTSFDDFEIDGGGAGIRVLLVEAALNFISISALSLCSAHGSSRTSNPNLLMNSGNLLSGVNGSGGITFKNASTSPMAGISNDLSNDKKNNFLSNSKDQLKDSNWIKLVSYNPEWTASIDILAVFLVVSIWNIFFKHSTSYKKCNWKLTWQ